MPTLDELLISVRDFLREDVMQATSGRANFLARVASNSLDIVRREAVIGPGLRQREADRLADLFGSREPLSKLRWRVVHGLRDGSLDLNNEALIEYLREAVVNQVAIDQPRYTGYQTARRNCGQTA